ncbi:GAF:Pyridoxamine 5'-phosphate oxidase-related, FMN-binding protein [Fulvimarina pelagi HTCC2506]|uniref:GAF:Pyridoxamine 5'-phosphate oxidase-related, FMN-binding protein n=2 Tax=Fulvimarina pelagi TaxID=217511 RepID=Q0FYI8_9HYPH|nr:GAF domain-containing protein [Fulvimarina pelagi]EAU40007.1 GAF:Pyridoxamine 5'-phosphate oxidase-related, FMN-binding protein [Fulvimarina pelagi HTCC2506]BAT31049.1 pyridoxamine 5'-phosphate oxidase-related FMN-binding protein with GAF domain [Fulvimarina pelagi]
MTSLDQIRNCLEGVVPAFLATSDKDGMPNVSEISQVHYVDPSRVALSYQFFNKTRRNVLETRVASVVVVDPDTNAQFRLDLDYEETQTAGPLFEAMRAKLAGIASHSGMEKVFRLLGSDLFLVRRIESLESHRLEWSRPCNPLSAARRVAAVLNAMDELGPLLDALLDALEQHLGIGNSMVLMLDREANRLFTVASHGYATTGIGSEIGLGSGVIGVAAAEGVPIRIGHLAAEYSYGAAIRSAAGIAENACPETVITYPGLEAPLSQIALPLRPLGKTIGVLFAESLQRNRFSYDDEDVLQLIAESLGMRILLGQSDGRDYRAVQTPQTLDYAGSVRLRHYRFDDTVFIDEAYLIKGVAGAIFWKLASEHAATGRTEFSNRELRLDPSLRLPAQFDNLESRLLLLQRRLAERGGHIQIARSGRGRFRLDVANKLELELEEI